MSDDDPYEDMEMRELDWERINERDCLLRLIRDRIGGYCEMRDLVEKIDDLLGDT